MRAPSPTLHPPLAAAVPLAVLPALAAELDRWIASGHAHHDWTVIASDVRAPGRNAV